MRLSLLFVCLLITVSVYSQNTSEKYQQAKVQFSSSEELNAISDLGIPIDHGVQYKDKFILSDFSVAEINRLKNAGYQVEILIEDSKQHFLQKNRIPSISRNVASPPCDNFYPTPANFEFGSMGGYLTYQELLDELDEMVLQYPNLITTPENISTFLTEGEPDPSTTPSIGSNPIKWVKISDNPNSTTEGEPEILYTAIHHAREPLALSQLVFYMWYLLENYDNDPEIKTIVDETELYFIPVVNPDGYLYNEKTDPNGGGFWRKNRKDGTGVDNNRNYDYYINGDPSNNTWGGSGTSNDPTSEIYHGPSAFSEVETQAVKWFCEQHDFVVAVNNHSFGNGLYFPYGYEANSFTPDHDLYETFLDELVSKNGYLVAKVSGLAGLADDFMYGTIGTHNKIFSFTPEIGSTFWLPSEQILPISKEMMYTNITSAKMANGSADILDTSPIFIGDNLTLDHEFTFTNFGLSGNGNFTVSMNPISLNIVVPGATIQYTNLNPMERVLSTMEYTLDSGILEGDDIAFELEVSNGTFSETYLVNKKFGTLQTILMDTGDSTDNFRVTEWVVSDARFVSPLTSITDSHTSPYQNNENKIIEVLHSVNLVDAVGANVTFNALWNLEIWKDMVQFEVSIDDGTSWIPQCGNFTSEGSGFGVQPINEPVYNGGPNEWFFETIDLNDYLGENIRLRFRLVTDEAVRRDGFYFDDLTINVLGNGFLNLSETEKSLFSIFPNPVKDIVSIATSSQNYDIDVFNIQGQLVSKTQGLQGTQSFDYSNYASGMYLLLVSSETASKAFKIIKE